MGMDCPNFRCESDTDKAKRAKKSCNRSRLAAIIPHIQKSCKAFRRFWEKITSHKKTGKKPSRKMPKHK